ncbi:MULTISPECIES: heavy metal response regulator transcription factor [unclassified Massilia]|uniref:heavy metal response regulator transcription factor n=1 Tax=Massilia TaxID=149698 RepID=UPI0025B71BBD|nr:heavy metal response regulator transcription factor [Massilia sp. YIM B02763]MDN4052000.1 heavy metal response regulator transcription factor [Massilia sp. YIM B02763]
MAKILLVEDQATAAAYLSQGLKEEGMVVDVASNGPDGLHLLLTADYDVAILDVMLPGLDGWTILETARRARRQTPVLFLTARDAIDDRVRGLDLGAEDYLVKPFAFSELLARVRVILRRNDRSSTHGEQTIFHMDDLTLDLLKHRATRGGERLDLTPKEFALLSLLMRRAGEVQSRTVLAEQVWDMHFDSDTNVVEVAVRRLRTKLDDPFPVKLLHTVRGVGYVLEVRA